MAKRYTFDVNALNDETLLLKMISQRNEAAFRVFFDRHRKLVYNYAYHWIKSREVAEEIMLDVFVKVWQLENPQAINNAEYFLRTMTRNMVISALRRKNLAGSNIIELSEEIVSLQQGPESMMLEKEVNQLLERAIEQLPVQQRKVYELCRIEGLKYNQAAEKLSLSPLTVKTHMQHALRSLRKYVDMHQALIWLVMLLLSQKNK